MTASSLGLLSWRGSVDKEGHREYRAVFKVRTTDPEDGPDTILSASGLPTVGSPWVYGNDNNPYALCWPNAEADPVIDEEKNTIWKVGFTFTTRPFSCCASQPRTDPLSMPQEVSGSFVTYQKLAQKDRNGKAIMSSSLEPLNVMRDFSRPSVVITQNVLSLELPMLTEMINTLNDASLWGLNERCIKLRNTPWKRLVYGVCTFYYQRTLEFDCKFESFDEKEVADMGTRVIDPDKLAADPNLNRDDPANFIRLQDERGNLQRPVMLDGNGEINPDPANNPTYVDPIELYEESNFLLLGIPTSF